MAQTKPRQEVKEKKKKKNSMVVLDNQPVEIAAEPESLWQEEVEGLLGQKFDSLLELIDTIADRVCKRLGQEEDSNLHEFIVMMLDTDDEIRQELKELFSLS
jgi:hypothetical protein